MPALYILSKSIGSYSFSTRVLCRGSSAALVRLTRAHHHTVSTLIYYPNYPPRSRTDLLRPLHIKIRDFEELVIPTGDGEKLSAFHICGPRGSKNCDITIMLFHGSVGNIGHQLSTARMIINYIGCNVFIPEYRGYGTSTGKPDESGLNIDADTALNYIQERTKTRNHRIIVYGRSLGGAVSIKLVSRNQDNKKIAGLIVENTFLSIPKLISFAIPPAKYLTFFCRQVWPNEIILPKIKKVPILFLSGLQDNMVP